MQKGMQARRLGVAREVDGRFVVEMESDRFELSPVAAALWSAADGESDVAALLRAVKQVEPAADKSRVFGLLDELARVGIVADVPAPPAEPMVGRRSLFKSLAVGAAVAAMAPAVVRAQVADTSGDGGQLCADTSLYAIAEQKNKAGDLLTSVALEQLKVRKMEQDQKRKQVAAQEESEKAKKQISEEKAKADYAIQEEQQKVELKVTAEEQAKAITAKAEQDKKVATSAEEKAKIQSVAEEGVKSLQAIATPNEQAAKAQAEQENKLELAKQEQDVKTLKADQAKEQEEKASLTAQEEAQKQLRTEKLQKGALGPKAQEERQKMAAYSSSGYGVFGSGKSPMYVEVLGETLEGSVQLEQIASRDAGAQCLIEATVQFDAAGDVRAMMEPLLAAAPGAWDIPQPVVALQWGSKGQFAGLFYLTEVSVAYTGFDADGTPLRASAQLSLIAA